MQTGWWCSLQNLRILKSWSRANVCQILHVIHLSITHCYAYPECDSYKIKHASDDVFCWVFLIHGGICPLFWETGFLHDCAPWWGFSWKRNKQPPPPPHPKGYKQQQQQPDTCHQDMGQKEYTRHETPLLTMEMREQVRGHWGAGRKVRLSKHQWHHGWVTELKKIKNTTLVLLYIKCNYSGLGPEFPICSLWTQVPKGYEEPWLPSCHIVCKGLCCQIRVDEEKLSHRRITVNWRLFLLTTGLADYS